MPYKVQGKKVLHKKAGTWSVKQTAKTPENAKAAMRLLYGVEHGMVPRERKRRLSQAGR